jgi:hypothetical protein
MPRGKTRLVPRKSEFASSRNYTMCDGSQSRFLHFVRRPKPFPKLAPR